MFEQIVIILISAFAGYGAKYFWDKKLFLYKKKLKAIKKLREAVGILTQGQILYSQMRKLDFKKIESSDEPTKHKIQQFLDLLQTKQTIERLSNKLKTLNIQSDIQPYIPDDIWVIFNAYMTIFANATLILGVTPYCLSYIKKERMEEGIIDNIIPIIPEKANFIKESPIIKVFHVEDLIRKKLLTKIEDLNKRHKYLLLKLFA